MSGPPPLYQQTLGLAAGLCELLDSDGPQLGLREDLRRAAVDLVDRVALAIAGIDRIHNLVAADAALCTLRARLDLAHRCEVFDDAHQRALAERTEEIGRQIGGWLRALTRRRGDASTDLEDEPNVVPSSASAPNLPKATKARPHSRKQEQEGGRRAQQEQVQQPQPQQRLSGGC